MKIIHTLLLALIMSASTFSFAQVQQKQSKKPVRIDVFTPGEKDQIQFWFHEQSDSLKLNTDQYNTYTNVILTNLTTIYHLTDRDKNFSIPEIKKRLGSIINKINKQSKPILDAQQYNEHLVTMGRLEKAFNNRLDNPSEETNFYNYLKEKE